MSHPDVAVITSTFQQFDTNGDGEISEEDMANIFLQLDPSLSKDDLEVMFDAADQNGDGVIHYKEFAKWLTGEWDDGGKEASDMIMALPNSDDEEEDKEEEVNATVDAQATPTLKRSISRWASNFRLYCMRHGRPEATTKLVRDPPLAPNGKEQAQKLSVLLRREVKTFDVIITSPMARVLETAAPLFEDGGTAITKKVICHAALCEHKHDPGNFEPQRIAAAQPALLGEQAQHETTFVGFGTHEECTLEGTRRRCELVAAWLRNESASWPKGAVIGIFCHQTVLDCLLQIMLHGSADAWEYGDPKFKIDVSAFSEFLLGPSGKSVVRRNVKG